MSELTKTEALQLLNTEEAAGLLGVNSIIMETWRRKGTGPHGDRGSAHGV